MWPWDTRQVSPASTLAGALPTVTGPAFTGAGRVVEPPLRTGNPGVLPAKSEKSTKMRHFSVIFRDA